VISPVLFYICAALVGYVVVLRAATVWTIHQQQTTIGKAIKDHLDEDPV
jgi:hypothetical protein